MKMLRVLVFAAVLMGVLCAAGAEPAVRKVPAAPLRPVYLQRIKVRGFWRDQFKRLTEKWLPHCVKQMENGGQGQELLNFVHAAKVLKGEPAGKFTGRPWSDAYIYNTIESICLALAIDPDGDTELTGAQTLLRGKLEEWIPLVLAAQTPDGYIHSFHVVNGRDRYTNTGNHEFYVQGYFIEAGVAHYRVTGGKDRRLYDAARKCADHLCETFGPPPRRNWVHGHPGMGYALCRLARLVGEAEGAGKGRKYADLAKYLFDNRHADEKHRRSYQQSHLPVVEQSDAVGHAVRATYFYTGIADLAMLTGDRAYLRAVDSLWDSAVNRKLYITGGVGASHRGEAFDVDYELRNNGYCESCAGCGLSFWADRMNRIHHDGRYMDVQERVLYNNILGAIELSGENFFYQNPLASDRARYPWHGCPCCVGNIPRALIAIKDVTYALNAERDTLFVNHFVAGEGTVADVAGTSLRVEQRTEYPWKGDVSIVLTPAAATAFAVKIRIPSRAGSALYTASPDLAAKCSVKVNGKPQDVKVVNGYAGLSRNWQPGDCIDVSLPMDVQRIHADGRVEADRGRVALQRGPLVYNIENVDHDQDVRSVVLPPDAPLKAVW
ncbi:MAG: beta-L-arabinofuranosidase domain-containing protein, partial [Phycisphaerae bacterium]